MLNGISRSFVQGYLLGLAGMPVKTALGAAIPPAADREKPAMFLYNGMGPLPALPEGYDRCPYATVTDMGDGAYRLHLSDMPFFARVNDSGTFNLANYYSDTGILFYMFTHTAAGSWSVYNPDILGTNRFIAGSREKGWANYDMLTKTGDVHIRKSAPIPVIGEKENPIAPSVFLAGLRFGIISRQSNALPELPDGVLISSDGYILRDCNGVYLIAAVDAEPDEPAVPGEPGEVATMYLYGTPSESGNIGLRVGDTVTYYSGVVLPALPEWDKTVYPYAVIVEYKATILNKENRAYLYLLKNQSDRYLQEGSIDTEYIYYHAGDMYYKATSAEDEPYTEWTESGILSEDKSFSLENIKWTNEPIYYQYDNHYGASGDLALAASDPIPVGEIVDYIDDIPIYEQKEDA